MPFLPARRSLWLCTGGAVLWLAALAYAHLGAVGYHVVFRFLIGAFAVVLGTAFLRGPNRLLLLSPLYLIGCLFLIFYSWVPAVFAAIAVPNPGWGPAEKLTVAGVGGGAEAIALQFAAFCLLAAAIVHAILRSVDSRRSSEAAPDRPPDRWLFNVAAAAALGLAMLAVAIRWVPALQAAVGGFDARQVTDGLAPLASLCVAIVGYSGAHANRHAAGLASAVVVVCVALLLASNLAETPLYIGFSVLGTMALKAHSFRWHKGLAISVSGSLAVLLTVALLSAAFLRGALPPLPTAKAVSLYLQDVLVRKLVLREGVPVGCMQAILSGTASPERSGDPFYFRFAVVPRVLWPDKPSLSLGSEYGARFCGNPEARATGHSESITLIGEPLLHGGMSGLAVAQATLAAVLGLVTIIGSTGGPLRSIALTAMLPWLMAFDQHFAFYLANAIKTFLYMMPFLAILWWLAMRAEAKSARRSLS